MSEERESTEPSVSIIVPTYRRPDRLSRLIGALEAQTFPAESFEVLIVDDCSGDNTTEVLEAAAARVPYRLRPLKTDINRGPGPARNVGLMAARAPILAFTDDDCVPEPDWLESGYKLMHADPRLGVLQGRTWEPDGLDNSAVHRWSHRQRITGPTPWFEACNIFYRRAALEDAGGFGADWTVWGGWYAEDTKAGWGALEAGWQRGYTDEAVVIHDEEIRTVRWYIDKGVQEATFSELAVRYPDFRQEAFWRPWAVRREDAEFVAALLSLAVATRWRPALAGTLPYLWARRPSVRQPQFFRRGAETVAVDAARVFGHLYGSLRHGTLVI